MVKTLLYCMYKEETLVSKLALKIGHDRMAAILIAMDAVCWGALLVFGAHFFTCGG